MMYRRDYHHNPDSNCDVFDGWVYRQLLDKYVALDGKELRHRYFSDPRDIALGFSTDGFCPFRRRKSTCWPLLLYNYNLPPELRILQEYILCLGVVPGPNKPKDMDSFLWPAVEELLRLAVGVRAFDSIESALFSLHAYLITGSGDIPAISMLMKIKGHNGYSPCRACKITGVLEPKKPTQTRQPTTYYIPLDRRQHPSVQISGEAIRVYDPANLPLRTHSEMLAQAREVQSAPTGESSKTLSRLYGINGLPLLSYLSSLSFPGSFPYDFMHIVWENLIPNLISLWTGNFKGLDEGCEAYGLNNTVWKAIGKATAESGSTLPSSFCARPPNIEADRSPCTADSWSFWALYLGPVLLHRKFRKRKYYDHFVDLIKLLHICLQFELSKDDIHTLRVGFQNWVLKYEEYEFFHFCTFCIFSDYSLHKVLLSVFPSTRQHLYSHSPRFTSHC